MNRVNCMQWIAVSLFRLSATADRISARAAEVSNFH